MTDLSEKEAAAELLLEAKGFKDVVVNLTGETADIVVPDAELSDAQRAQIEDIVKRKTGIAAENIVITPLKEGEDVAEDSVDTAADVGEVQTHQTDHQMILPMRTVRHPHSHMKMQRLTRLTFMIDSPTVTVHTSLSREVFWHENAKIPRHTARLCE